SQTPGTGNGARTIKRKQMSVRVNRVTISQILGIEELDFNVNKVERVEGGNAKGKTSVIEAFKAALGGGRVAHIVRNGAEKGEVVIELMRDDLGQEPVSVTVRKSFTAEGSSDLTVLEGTRKVAKPQAYLNELIDPLALNPIDFILEPNTKKRTVMLLQTMPLELSAD